MAKCFVCNKRLDTDRIYCKGSKCIREMLTKAKYTETNQYTWRGVQTHNEKHIGV